MQEEEKALKIDAVLVRNLVIGLLVEGMGIRPLERALEPLSRGNKKIRRSEILRFSKLVGDNCAVLLDKRLRDIPCDKLQLDEMHSFIEKKDRHDYDTTDWEGLNPPPKDADHFLGQVWTYLALDPKTKLIVAYYVGKHTAESTEIFLRDIKSRIYMLDDFTIITDGYKEYALLIDKVFGRENVHYGTSVKYKKEVATKNGKTKWVHAGYDRNVVFGNPHPFDISTSLVERVNRDVRAHLRRHARRSVGHSKRLPPHIAAVALFIAYRNFCRIHSSVKATPAMVAGLESKPWSIDELILNSTKSTIV